MDEIINSIESNHIFIKAEGKLIRLYENEICFVKALRDYVKVVTEKKNYLSLGTLKSIEAKLENSSFIKVHRSYIINAKKIDCLSHNTIIIGIHEIPISKSRRKVAMDKLNIL
jgi:DNA-binding LytR/AlgR family response regulator